MKSNKLLFLCSLAASLLLAACAPGDEPLPTDQEIPQVACQGNLPAPIVVSPKKTLIISPQAPYTFTWTFPGNCEPKGYRFQLRKIPGSSWMIDQVLPGSSTQAIINTPLEPTTTYQWRVSAIPVVFPNNFIPNYSYGTFETGPVCDANNLATPNLTFPDANMMITSQNSGVIPGDDNVALQIELNITTCVPEYAEFFVSTTPDFSGINYHFNPREPQWALAFDKQALDLTSVTGNTVGGYPELPNCTTFYWRARVGVGDVFGLYSETRSFFTDFDNECPSILDFFPDLYWEEFLFPEPSPYAVPIENANCRLGDTLQHKNVATLFMGKPYKVIAVHPQFMYVRVHEPASDVDCWVWTDLIMLGFGEKVITPEELKDHVPVILPPPVATPTFTPEPDGPTATPAPQCSDGIDNDGDGLIDYNPTGAGDPQCRNANDNDETNP